MKLKLSIFLLLLSSLSVYAQKPTGSIKLSEDQGLIIQMTSQGNINQEIGGQSMETVFTGSTRKELIVNKKLEDSYRIGFKTSKLKMNVSMMGNEISKFDSDDEQNKGGSQSLQGNEINKTKNLLLSKKGFCISLDSATVTNGTDKEKADPVSQMMKQMLGEKTDESLVSSCFMLLPENIKQGDTWQDSTKTESISTGLSYQWDSTVNNIAVIRVTGKMNVNTVVNAMGSEANISLISDISETRKVDITNGIIRFRKNTSQMRGTIDLMGFSVPVTGTIESLTETE